MAVDYRNLKAAAERNTEPKEGSTWLRKETIFNDSPPFLLKETSTLKANELLIDPSPKWRPKFQIRENKLKLKTNTSTRKSILTLVTLPSFSISGEISAEKMYVEN